MTAPKIELPVFQSLGELAIGEGITFMPYGAAGTGKTQLAGTIGPQLFINIGGGIATLQSAGFRKLYPNAAKEIIVVTIEERFGRNGVYDFATMLDCVCDTIDHAVAHLRDKIGAIVVDDATALREGGMAKGVVQNARTQKSQTGINAKALGGVVPAMQDYGAEMSLLAQFASYYTKHLKNEGIHFVMPAHERNTFRKPNKKSGEELPVLMKTTPAFTGVDKNPDYITGYFDCVWHTRVVGAGNNRIYRIDTEGSELMVAKTRWSGVFKPVEEKLDLAIAVKRIRDSIK